MATLDELNDMRKQRDEVVSMLREVCGYLEGLGQGLCAIDEDQFDECFIGYAARLRRDLERIGDRQVSDMIYDLEISQLETMRAHNRAAVADKRANNLDQWRGMVCAEHPELWELRPDLTTSKPEIDK